MPKKKATPVGVSSEAHKELKRRAIEKTPNLKIREIINMLLNLPKHL